MEMEELEEELKEGGRDGGGSRDGGGELEEKEKKLSTFKTSSSQT